MKSNKSDNVWFEKRRDLFVTRMIKEFHATLFCFYSLYENYLKTTQLPFHDIEQLVGSESEKGLLWRLKDRTHQLWRNKDPKEDINGCLFDWIIGSIFHEAMKMKENIYMYQYYGPLAEEMSSKHSISTVRFCGVECKRFMERIAGEMQRQVENLGVMFGRACYLLRTMLPGLAENTVLLRYLVEHRQVPEELWFEKLPELFHEMFGSMEEGFCATARSYLAGQWLDKAQETYARALEVNEDCAEARHFFAQHKSLHHQARENDATMR